MLKKTTYYPESQQFILIAIQIFYLKKIDHLLKYFISWRKIKSAFLLISEY